MNRALEQCHSILDLRALAQRRLAKPIFHYMDGAAETEITARRNTSTFDDVSVMPRCLVDVSSAQTAVTVLGRRIGWPVLCGPTGASRLYHPEGEIAVARAAFRMETFSSLSVAGTHTIEAIARASAGPKLFQLMVFKDRALTRELIERCRVSGYQALCLTVDAAVRGKRERELHSGMGMSPKLTSTSLLRVASHARWLLGQYRRGPLSMPNLPQKGGDGLMTRLLSNGVYLGSQINPSANWDEVAKLVELWKGPFAIKGILHPGDARCAVDIGASAVIVSNHGGRQLDGAATPFEVLPRIVDAVAGRAEVILDGGVRRGVHVMKALACGAKAVMIGRPYLYGLAAGGEAGVVRALTILRNEFLTAMQLSGCTSADQVDHSVVLRA